MADHTHHRHNDRDTKCEYHDECNIPKVRPHKRSDDMELSRSKLLGIVVTTIITTILASYISGLLVTPQRLKETIADHPSIVKVQDDIKNLEDKVESQHTDLTNWQGEARTSLAELQEKTDRIAIVTGAEPSAARSKPKSSKLDKKFWPIYTDKDMIEAFNKKDSHLKWSF